MVYGLNDWNPHIFLMHLQICKFMFRYIHVAAINKKEQKENRRVLVKKKREVCSANRNLFSLLFKAIYLLN